MFIGLSSSSFFAVGEAKALLIAMLITENNIIKRCVISLILATKIVHNGLIVTINSINISKLLTNTQKGGVAIRLPTL